MARTDFTQFTMNSWTSLHSLAVSVSLQAVLCCRNCGDHSYFVANPLKTLFRSAMVSKPYLSRKPGIQIEAIGYFRLLARRRRGQYIGGFGG
jgi:hypothetical protein